jgi:hypothetical protein
MTTRRTVFVDVFALAANLATSNSTRAQDTSDPSKTGDFLFVQTAKGMSFDRAGGKLTLQASVLCCCSSPTLRSVSHRKHEYDHIRAVLEKGQGQLPAGTAERGFLIP